MKKAFLHTLAVACCILSAINLFGQCNVKLESQISNSDAIKAIKLFTSSKKAKYLNDHRVSCNQLLVPTSDMIEMLNYFQIQSKTKKYDGVRVYFIREDKSQWDSSKLSLLFVPTIDTIGDISCDPKYSKDVLPDAYCFSNNKLRRLNDPTAMPPSPLEVSNWLLGYGDLASKIPGAITVNFQEAKSNWYSKEVFFEKGALTDLLSYLKSCTVITGIEIYYANHFAKTTIKYCEKHANKSRPIFKLLFPSEFKNSPPPFFTLASVEIMKSRGFQALVRNNKFSKEALSTYTDTGYPCPPNKCN